MSRWSKQLVSVFVVFHMLAVTLWILPEGSVIRSAFFRSIEWYVLATGIWQSWNMFAPEPSNLNLYVHANIHYPDGTVDQFEMPRMDKLDFVDRYAEERFRKYIENVHLDQDQLFWSDLAAWIVRQDEKKTGKSPDSMEMIRTWWEVPVQMPADPGAPVDHSWRSYTFFRARIVKGVLRPEPVTL